MIELKVVIMNLTNSKRMNKVFRLLVIIILTPTFCFSQESSTDRIKLNEVIVEFKESINQKDSIRFKKLFFQDKVLFTGIMSKESEMSIKENYPEFEGIAVSDHVKFITDICNSEKKQEEKFYNINIETDRVISSISFDYSFYSDDKMIQWGHEKWNLVYADDLWLITDVKYSIRFPDIEEFPFEKRSDK